MIGYGVGAIDRRKEERTGGDKPDLEVRSPEHSFLRNYISGDEKKSVFQMIISYIT